MINNNIEVDYTPLESEILILLADVRGLTIEFKGVNKHYKHNLIKSKFMAFEYIMNADKTIDDNNISFIDHDNKKFTVSDEFKKATIKRIIEQTTIVNK